MFLTQKQLLMRILQRIKILMTSERKEEEEEEEKDEGAAGREMGGK